MRCCCASLSGTAAPVAGRGWSAARRRGIGRPSATAADVGLGLALVGIGGAIVGGTAWELGNTAPADREGRSGGASSSSSSSSWTDRLWCLGVVPIFLATPFFARATFREEIVEGRVWQFEQKQGIGLGLNTSVNTRMTAIRLGEGGLFLYNCIAPTTEMVQLVRDLGEEVKHIFLCTTTYEHKQFLRDMSAAFPEAEVTVAPHQYAWPVNDGVAVSRAGCPRAEVLAGDQDGTRQGKGNLPLELRSATLSLPAIGLSPFVSFTEVAVYHDELRCLLVSDSVCHLSSSPVPLPISRRDLMEWADDGNIAITGLRILGLFGVREKYAALERRKKREDRVAERSEEEARLLGWQRMALTSLYFGQRDVLQPQESFQALEKRKLFIPPVLATLVFGWEGSEGDPVETVKGGKTAAEIAAWSEKVAKFSFDIVIPAHFDVARANSEDWTEAFQFWTKPNVEWDYPQEDIKCLRDVRGFLKKVGVITC